MTFIIYFLFLFSYNNNAQIMENNNTSEKMQYAPLPTRQGPRPETTTQIPHVQINLKKVPEVYEEMVRRIYAIPGVEERPSAILRWRGMWLNENLSIVNAYALLSGREFSHIHDDGSLHIFLEPKRAEEAIEAGWAVLHPFAVGGNPAYRGFVMLYTPQSITELNTTFQLIVESYNFITGQNTVPTDLY